MLTPPDAGSSADPETFESLDDETEDLQTLTFDDLLSFAFQVAKGMEFLSSKNVRDRGPSSFSLFRQTQTQLVPFGLHGLTS